MSIYHVETVRSDIGISTKTVGVFCDKEDALNAAQALAGPGAQFAIFGQNMLAYVGSQQTAVVSWGA